MTPNEFIDKWRGVTQTERATAQTHFIDLCRLLGVPDPIQADPKGEWFCFEKGAAKAGGGDGWADVWRRRCFGWEYKRPGGSLPKAFAQLQLYTPALEYPPLLIVCDVQTIEIHTAFTGLVPVVHRITLEDLRDHAQRRLLAWAFLEPDRLKPTQSTVSLTEEAAGKLGDLAHVWRARGHDPLQVAHFSQQVLFCLFAEDIDLLPDKLFTKLLKTASAAPQDAQSLFERLFAAMATGGRIDFAAIDWFNGGLFASTASPSPSQMAGGGPLPLDRSDLRALLELADLDWSAIDPTIFGTLFERGLDPGKRAQLGAHYTDRASIMRLVNPVVLDPLQVDWATRKAEIQAHMEKASQAKSVAARTKARHAAAGVYQGFLERLRRFRVLDPACGSGNFLLLALLGLKDLEHRVILEAEMLGLPRALPMVGPENVLGIELNAYAAELARVVVWIGEIQWMLGHGFSLSKNPILKPLDTIAQRDAILNPDGTEPEWPEADAIVGNPPFLGDKKMLGALGKEYVTCLRSRYQGRVPGGADLVTYWFEKARAQLAAGRTRYVGLVATNSIRGGANRTVLDRIVETGTIFNAWSDEPWINEGAAVRVSLVGFGCSDKQVTVILNGQPVARIQADLTGAGEQQECSDLTRARKLLENAETSYGGIQKTGPFDISGELARKWLTMPNPHGMPNSEVVRPWYNGLDIMRRPRDMWIIDFGVDMAEQDAALFEQPFSYAKEHVQPTRVGKREKRTNECWWLFQWSRPLMRRAVAPLNHFIVTPEVSKHRVFAWLNKAVIPDKMLSVIARADDTTFGILHSRFHELWSLRMCTWLGKGNDPRYTPTTTFETFPFPEGLTPADTAGPTETLDHGVILPSVVPERRAVALAIAEAAHRLNQLRETWLNPPEWVDVVPEVVPGYPDRIVPKPEYEKALKARTLTNLYNQRPAWLDHAHKALDAAVAVAYGWTDHTPDLPDDEILRRLLALNVARSTGG